MDKQLLKQFQQIASNLDEREEGKLDALSTKLEILGYVVEVARASDPNIEEADAVELALMDSGTGAEELKGLAKTMRKLGYDAVADRLRRLSRRKIKAVT